MPRFDPTMLGAKSSLGGKGGNITNQSDSVDSFSNTPWAEGPANFVSFVFVLCLFCFVFVSFSVVLFAQ